MGKEMLRVARSVLSDLQLRQDDWPQLIPLIPSTINNAPSPQRKGVATITAFTVFLRSSDYQPVTMTEAQLESSLHLSLIHI